MHHRHLANVLRRVRQAAIELPSVIKGDHLRVARGPSSVYTDIVGTMVGVVIGVRLGCVWWYLVSIWCGRDGVAELLPC